MHCHVYASNRRQQTYVWLAERDQFEVLPAALAQRLGDLRFVLDVQLDSTRSLPNADACNVLEQLRRQGWYLQLPPDTAVTD